MSFSILVIGEVRHEHKVVVGISSKCNSGRNMRVKGFIYVTFTLCNSYKVYQTNSFSIAQERKITTPLFKK